MKKIFFFELNNTNAFILYLNRLIFKMNTYKLSKECILLDIQTQQSFVDWGKGRPGTGRRTMWDPGRTSELGSQNSRTTLMF